MIEDISQDHPDRMRIVIALNAGQCPDCDAVVSTTNRASVSAGTFSARPANKGSTSRRTRRDCISCSALAADHARNIRDDHPQLSRGEGLTYQHCPVFLRCHSCRGERRQPGRHSDHDLEPLGGGTHISLRRTIPNAISRSDRGGGKLARGSPLKNMLGASADRGVIDEIIIARQLARRGRGPLQ